MDDELLDDISSFCDLAIMIKFDPLKLRKQSLVELNMLIPSILARLYKLVEGKYQLINGETKIIKMLVECIDAISAVKGIKIGSNLGIVLKCSKILLGDIME